MVGANRRCSVNGEHADLRTFPFSIVTAIPELPETVLSFPEWPERDGHVPMYALRGRTENQLQQAIFEDPHPVQVMRVTDRRSPLRRLLEPRNPPVEEHLFGRNCHTGSEVRRVSVGSALNCSKQLPPVEARSRPLSLSITDELSSEIRWRTADRHADRTPRSVQSGGPPVPPCRRDTPRPRTSRSDVRPHPYCALASSWNTPAFITARGSAGSS